METKTKSSVGVVAKLFTRIPSDVRKMYNIKLLNRGKDMVIAYPSFITIREWDLDISRYDKGLSKGQGDFIMIALNHITIVMDDQKIDMQIILH